MLASVEERHSFRSFSKCGKAAVSFAFTVSIRQYISSLSASVNRSVVLTEHNWRNNNTLTYLSSKLSRIGSEEVISGQFSMQEFIKQQFREKPPGGGEIFLLQNM